MIETRNELEGFRWTGEIHINFLLFCFCFWIQGRTFGQNRTIFCSHLMSTLNLAGRYYPYIYIYIFFFHTTTMQVHRLLVTTLFMSITAVQFIPHLCHADTSQRQTCSLPQSRCTPTKISSSFAFRSLDTP